MVCKKHREHIASRRSGGGADIKKVKEKTQWRILSEKKGSSTDEHLRGEHHKDTRGRTRRPYCHLEKERSKDNNLVG